MSKPQKFYFVTGRPPFPDDMLRYDQASIIAEADAPWDSKSTIYLIMGDHCTTDRWRSFLWSVLPARNHDDIEWDVKFGDRWDHVEFPDGNIHDE